MENKRRFQRVRPTGLMSASGTIFVDLRSPPIVCNIVDVSAGGACIEVHGNDGIPKKFILNHGGVKKACRLVWQKGRRVGVSF
jgi:PilZ domain